MTTLFEKKVYNIVKRIPRGRVTVYAVIAHKIGRPGAARAVGNALNRNPYRNIPCHRVINSDGRIGGFARGAREKMRLLRREGVEIKNGRVASRYIQDHAH